MKQNYRQTLKALNLKVNQVLEKQGFDPKLINSLEFKQLKEEPIQLKWAQFQLNLVLFSDNPVIVENPAETQSYGPNFPLNPTSRR